jgi:hypothetical protein
MGYLQQTGDEAVRYLSWFDLHHCDPLPIFSAVGPCPPSRLHPGGVREKGIESLQDAWIVTGLIELNSAIPCGTINFGKKLKEKVTLLDFLG